LFGASFCAGSAVSADYKPSPRRTTFARLVGAHLINYPAKALPACRARDGTLRKDGLKVIEEERLRYGKKKNDFGDPA